MPPVIRAGLGGQRLTAGDEPGCAIPTTATTERLEGLRERPPARQSGSLASGRARRAANP
jgi:hypothetical protein